MSNQIQQSRRCQTLKVQPSEECLLHYCPNGSSIQPHSGVFPSFSHQHLIYSFQREWIDVCKEAFSKQMWESQEQHNCSLWVWFICFIHLFCGNLETANLINLSLTTKQINLLCLTCTVSSNLWETSLSPDKTILHFEVKLKLKSGEVVGWGKGTWWSTLPWRRSLLLCSG